MSEFGLAWLAASAQITLLAVVVLFAIRAVRMRPDLAACVGTIGLVACVALTGIAFCPVPSGWSWMHHLESPSAKMASLAEDSFAASSAGPPSPAGGTADAPSGISARELLRRLQAGMRPAQGTESLWPAALGWLFLLGAIVGGLRLSLGLWAVRALVRRSEAVIAPRAVQLLDQLRALLDLRLHVRLRETAELATPATIGTLRPVLLLPAGWRRWNDDELRAVLAHELVHIRRWDFAAGLVTQVCLALHLLHPLVRWLANQVHLQQELRADEEAAHCLAGRTTYLHALARLALVQDVQAARPTAWPARAFLSRTGTLKRRIHMLRMKERAKAQRSSWLIRVVLLAMGAGLTAVLAGVRLPEMVAAPRPRTEKPGAGEAFTPFDLRYAPVDAKGFFAFRPAAFFCRPELKPLADIYNTGLAMALPGVGLPAGLGQIGLRVENVAEFSGGIYHRHDDTQPPGAKNSIVMNLHLIRLKEPFDWKGKLKEAVPGLEEAKHGGVAYWRFPKDAPGVFRRGVACLIPDDRTLVLDTEENLKKVIERGDKAPDSLWLEGWKNVDRCLFALALQTDWVAKETKGTLPEDPPFQVVKHTQHLAVGVKGPANLAIHGHAVCELEENAVAAVKQLNEALADALKEVREKPVGPNVPEAIARGVMLALLEAGQVKRTGRHITFRSETDVDAAAAIAAALKP
jgi:beta-lactamase regulating signal transducer with metallopeptidase domain